MNINITHKGHPGLLTTDNAASSYGIPVLVLEEPWFSPDGEELEVNIYTAAQIPVDQINCAERQQIPNLSQLTPMEILDLDYSEQREIDARFAEAIAAYDEADGPSDDLGDAVYATEQAAMARLAAQEVQS